MAAEGEAAEGRREVEAWGAGSARPVREACGRKARQPQGGGINKDCRPSAVGSLLPCRLRVCPCRRREESAGGS